MSEVPYDPNDYRYVDFDNLGLDEPDDYDSSTGYPDPMPVTEYLPDQHAGETVEAAHLAMSPAELSAAIDAVLELDPVVPQPPVEPANQPVREPLFVSERSVSEPEEIPNPFANELFGSLTGIELPEEVDWGMIDYGDLQREQIKPGLIINGVQMIRYFDGVEQETVGAISPLTQQLVPEDIYVSSELALATEPHIARDRIANHLRPKIAMTEFVGRLLNGQAIILPLDTERVPIAHSPHARSTSWRGQERERTGANVLYTGLLRSSRGEVGQLVVEASYLVRHNVRARTGSSSGYLQRGIKISPAMANAEATLDRQYRDSAKNALAVARHAIHYAYGSGFGTKRRT